MTAPRCRTERSADGGNGTVGRGSRTTSGAFPGSPGLTPQIPFPAVVPHFLKHGVEMACRCPGVVRILIHVSKTESGKEPSMTWQPSSSPQHCVLRGEAAMPIDRQPASHKGKRSYLERRRD